MPYIEWQDWMTIGIAPIDADHKVLVSLINQVHSSIGGYEEYATLGSLLKALADYTDYHFQREEKLQEAAGFPGMQGHKRLHADLEMQVRELIRRHGAAQTSVRAVDVQSFLERWLIDHICHHDIAYRRYALGNNEAEMAATAVDITTVRGQAQTNAFDWSQLRILVVDDNANFLSLMETVLSGIGVGYVKTAPSATDALNLLSRQAVDALIVDLQMSAMDGLDLVTNVRASKDPIIANVAIMMVTGHGDPEQRDKAVVAGADDFLPKPLSVRELLVALARIVNARRP